MNTVLAIETSCDETACAVVRLTDDGGLQVLANVVHSQASLHAKWGGVIPALASREHIRNIAPVIEEALERADVTAPSLDALAVTKGPGLMPALVVGVTAANTLATLWDKPLLGIHHLEGHIYANLLTQGQSLTFPLLALLVSGGHTQLVLMSDHFTYTLLGQTHDDAVGEAFDKVAKMLDLPYPGGPEIAKRADSFAQSASTEEKESLQNLFPRPMLASNNYDFSYSGLKTAVRYFIQKSGRDISDETFRREVAYAFQEAAIDVLVEKTKRALQQYFPASFCIAGGVSANHLLRAKCETLIQETSPQTAFLMPEFQYSLDNAAMIGAAACLRLTHHMVPDKHPVEPSAQLAL